MSDPPELVCPPDGVAKPDGKSDSGSSTDCSCVPVSCPAAAGSGVIDALGSAAGAEAAGAEAAGAEAEAEPAGLEAEAEGVADAAELDELLDDDEQPATALTTPATAARAARDGRARRTITDDTELPTDTGLPQL